MRGGYSLWWGSLLEAVMQGDSFVSDDPGTILESFDAVPRAIAAAGLAGSALPARPSAPAAPAIAAPEEVVYRSPYRWTAPRILICDDGSLDDGEIVYLRSDSLVIGRSKADIVIGHDAAMSGSHAEISRRDVGGKFAWVLRDLGSANGTLARARTVTLKPGTLLLLGSKRYRFELPGMASAAAPRSAEAATALLSDLGGLAADALPALVEVIPQAGSPPQRLPFRGMRVTIGRPGQGNMLEIDDLCLAKTHAVVTRDVSGAWQLEAQPSLNGVWVKVDAIRLADNCFFQCGEQRFRFRA
jgi:pSer/pThr/pTyr-binding forkhead associated (FHA) protein